MSAAPPSRRRFLAAAALPLLIGALGACGYGSQREDGTGKVGAAGEKVDGLDSVRIGYFPNLTHATALVGDHEGIIQRELGGTKVKSTTFNAGPSEIEALN